MRFYSPFLIFLVHQCINSIIGEAVITGFVTSRGRTRLTQPALSNPCQAAAEPSSERSRTCRFDISVGLVSKYITTWTASYTTTLRKLSWWLLCSKWEPRCLLPVAFKQKYPTTYAIIDAVRCSLKHHQTSNCSHQHGAVTSTKYHKISCCLHPQTFMEGRKQLPSEEVLKGRQITSVRIHMERAIGFIKNNSILKGTLPLTCIYGSTSQPDCLCVCMAH